MKRLFSSILGSYIYVKGQSRPIHVVQNLIINPSNGVLMAIVVDNLKGLIVVVEDILFFGDFIQINDMDSVVEYRDIIRISKVVDKGVWFLNARVETASGSYLGEVYDFIINKFLMVESLYTSKQFFYILKTKRLIIGAKNILKIRNGVIVIKDDVVRGQYEADKVTIEEVA